MTDPTIYAVRTGLYRNPMLSWDGGKNYLTQQAGSNHPYYRTNVGDGAVSISPFVASFNAFVSASNEVQPGYVPGHHASAFSGATYGVRIFAVNDGDLSVASYLDYPINPQMSDTSIPRVKAMMVPLHGGKVYLFVSMNDGTLPGMWMSDVDTGGLLQGFTRLGDVTFPDPGQLPGGGTRYHSANLGDMQMFGNLGYSPNTRTLWNVNNPLVLMEAYNAAGADGTINPSLDNPDSGYGAASGCWLNPNHLLIGRRDNNNLTLVTRCTVVDVGFNEDGTVASRQTWVAPSTEKLIVGSTWARMADGSVGAVAVTRNPSFQHRFFYDLFGDPQEVILPPEWAGPNGVSCMAPARDAGWLAAVQYSSAPWVMNFRWDLVPASKLKRTDQTFISRS